MMINKLYDCRDPSLQHKIESHADCVPAMRQHGSNVACFQGTCVLIVRLLAAELSVLPDVRSNLLALLAPIAIAATALAPSTDCLSAVHGMAGGLRLCIRGLPLQTHRRLA